MVNVVDLHICVVDDEPRVLETIGQTLGALGRQVKVDCFGLATACLAHLKYELCDLLITDVRMDGMNGFELLAEARKIMPRLPVLMITGFGDVGMAVRAMKAGASNFIEKPIERSTFLETVQSALESSATSGQVAKELLTITEIKIMDLVLDGKSNREIAYLLSRSVRTIEDHRNHIMHKLGAHNIVELVRKAAGLGLFEVLRPEDKQS